jgi:RNA polymerase sigma-70 factor, ECF subfamily
MPARSPNAAGGLIARPVSHFRLGRCYSSGARYRVQGAQRSPVAVTSQKLKAAGTAARRTEETTFETLFLEHYPRVYDVLFRLVGDRAEAEDLALETFWKLWERAPAQADNLGGWLYRVAVRLGYNALRAARRRWRYEENAGRDALTFNAPVDPARAAEQRAERARVRVALSQLPSREAQLLTLRYSGLAYKEIAAALDLAPGSVGALLARAEKEFERVYGRGED